MNAIDLLKQQHREVEDLFGRIEAATDPRRYRLFETVADALTIHAEIEEKIFYPGVKGEDTTALLHTSVREHFQVKKLLKRLLDAEPEAESFDTDFQTLVADVREHVNEEETMLFPKVQADYDVHRLEMLGDQMQRMCDELQQEDVPSDRVYDEIQAPAQI